MMKESEKMASNTHRIGNSLSNMIYIFFTEKKVKLRLLARSHSLLFVIPFFFFIRSRVIHRRRRNIFLCICVEMHGSTVALKPELYGSNDDLCEL